MQDWEFRHWSTYTAAAWVLLGVIALHVVLLAWLAIRWRERRRWFARTKLERALRSRRADG